MAKTAKRLETVRLLTFQIVHPSRDERICIRESDGTIPVLFNGDPRESYFASICFFAPGTGTGAGSEISSGNLIETSLGSGQYTLDLTVGAVASNPPVGTNNRVIRVSNPVSGDIEGHAFAAIHCGSVSQSVVRAERRCPNCDPHRPVPVALILHVGKGLEAGTCKQCARLGKPTLLTHSKDAKYPCSWFSQPIAFCSGKTPAGIWVLQKADSHTWALTLRQADRIVATYSLTTKKKKDCSFPLELRRVGKAGKECTKWPMTVRIEPAP